MCELGAHYWQCGADILEGDVEGGLLEQSYELSERLKIPGRTAKRFIDEMRRGRRFFLDDDGKSYSLDRYGLPKLSPPDTIYLRRAARLLGLPQSVILALNIKDVFEYEGRGKPVGSISVNALHRLQDRVFALNAPLLSAMPETGSCLRSHNTPTVSRI